MVVRESGREKVEQVLCSDAVGRTGREFGIFPASSCSSSSFLEDFFVNAKMEFVFEEIVVELHSNLFQNKHQL